MLKGLTGVSMWAKLIRWWIFTVALSLAPLVVDYIAKLPAGGSPSPSEIISHGELCLVCAALSGVGLGELVGLNEKAAIPKLLLAGVCFLFCVLSIALYQTMKAQAGSDGSPALDTISWWVFGGTFLTSTIAVAVSEATK